MKARDTDMTIRVSAGSSSLDPKSLNMFSKPGMTKSEQDREHADEDDDDDARVDHRAADLPAQLHGLLDVHREALEDGVEDAAHLAGLDEVHVEVVEHLGVAAQRVAERRALLDARFDVAQDVREELVVGLPLQDVEALHDGQTGVDHRREEAREGDDVLVADAGADLEGERLELLLDLRRLELLRAEARVDRLFGLGLHGALAQLTAARACFPGEFGHRSVLDYKVYKWRGERVKE